MKNKRYYETKKCKCCGNEFESLISRKQQFCSSKCSSKYTAKDESRLQKIKQTKLERYGNESYVNPKKAKKTCLKKYGVDNVSKCDIIKNKISDTVKKKYGVEYYFQSQDIKDRVKESFGVDNMSQLSEVKERVRDTVRNKYGVDNVFQSSEIKDKMRQTYQDKYGVDFPSQVPEIKNKKLNAFKTTFYNKLCTTHKLNLKVEPLFSLQDYINTDRNNLYKFRCLKCESIFEDHIDGGHLPRCQKCYPLNKGSICEQEIYEFICQFVDKSDIIQNNRTVIDGKEIDIYIPSKKIAIEYDSLYYHSDISVQSDYHINKTTACEKQGIRLIHVFEDEWVFKQNIVKSKLKNILGVSDKKIYARKCSVREISVKEKNEFLNKTHIQGEDKSKVKLGLFYDDDELVAVMTFSAPRVALGLSSSKNGEYELSRYSSLYNVVGGAGKLFSHFTRQFNPNRVISYADRRYSWEKSSVYDKIGFTFTGTTDINFWYFKNGYSKRYHRFSFRKSMLPSKLKTYDESLTAYENMQLNGYNRIYDCGSLRFIWQPC